MIGASDRRSPPSRRKVAVEASRESILIAYDGGSGSGISNRTPKPEVGSVGEYEEDGEDDCSERQILRLERLRLVRRVPAPTSMLCFVCADCRKSFCFRIAGCGDMVIRMLLLYFRDDDNEVLIRVYTKVQVPTLESHLTTSLTTVMLNWAAAKLLSAGELCRLVSQQP